MGRQGELSYLSVTMALFPEDVVSRNGRKAEVEIQVGAIGTREANNLIK